MNVNNHIHTTFSFSPYSPAQAVAKAKESGLTTCGLMDHDTLAGAYEFFSEAKKINMPVTCGLETRVKMDGDFKETRLNNPDQKGIAYFALHGVPRQKIMELTEVFAPYREKRNERNIAMCDKLNAMTNMYGINLSFDNDVLPLSEYLRGGTVTERHICYAFGKKLISRYGKGENLVKFLKKMCDDIPQKQEEYLLDEKNEHYEYDLLGVLKSSLSGKFYIPAGDECMSLDEFIAIGKEVGAIVSYAYLGDVSHSVTGDKKPFKFEDDYLDDLFEYLKDKEINAITYMPTRNTGYQLQKLRSLCKKHDFFEISGEDINSSRQKFICEELQKSEYSHLVESTLALIGHELCASQDLENGMFSKKIILEYPLLSDRINYFKSFCKIE